MLRLIRRLLPFTSIALLIALIYAGWTVISRRRANAAVEREAATARTKANQRIAEQYGNGRLKILAFYASPPSLNRGEKGLICYGVSNAKTVRIEPDVEPVSPAMSRCIAIAGAGRPTKYTLTAEDAQGHAETQSFILPAH